MKRSWIVIVIVAFLFLGLAALLAFSPTSATLMLGQLWYDISGHPTQPPLITEGLITAKDWLHADEAGNRVSKLLERRFPIGSIAAPLRKALEDQGFKSFPNDVPNWSALVYHWGNVVCDQWLTVEWRADNRDRIRAIRSRYGNACL